MLVYGDQREFAVPGACLDRIAGQIGRAARVPPGIDRHAAIAAALIESGRLLQGVADDGFARTGEDDVSPAVAALARFSCALARAVVRSWDSGYADLGELPAVPAPSQLPERVELRLPEGYAFYCVYPEAYIVAARRLALRGTPRIIGLRSIGTSLAAVVAAALDAEVPVTLRPFGDPFARTIAPSPQLERQLLSGNPHFIIVDEGPGQSGSSFGAVADWLEDRGVPGNRIAFLPSHAGDLGPCSSERHGERWRRAQRAVADLGAELPLLLRQWLEPVLGALDQPLLEISGGEWRRHVRASEEERPGAIPMWERRKFLAAAGGERFLVKFAGLGELGERKMAMARALHTAGLSAEPVALVHGFLVERWHDDAVRLGPGEKPIADVARYIGARARLFPASAESGATLEQLAEMTRRNLSLAGGAVAAASGPLAGDLEPLSRRVVRVKTDNKLDRHEWLRSGGRLLKSDALDHHIAHDLIGCQDVAWDVAGAIAEFDLDAREAAALISGVERAAGRHVDRDLLAFYRIAYAAFRLGQFSMGAGMCADASAESGRLRRSAARHLGQAQHLLLESTGRDSAGMLPQWEAETNRRGNKPATASVEEEDAALSR
jgi:hypothetical protein